VVDSERYFLTVMRYIELNPVRADMVAHPRDYRWSSYGRNAHGETGQNVDWLAAHREYRRLGLSSEQRQMAYRQLFRAPWQRMIFRRFAIVRTRDGRWAARASPRRSRR